MKTREITLEDGSKLTIRNVPANNMVDVLLVRPFMEAIGGRGAKLSDQEARESWAAGLRIIQAVVVLPEGQSQSEFVANSLDWLDAMDILLAAMGDADLPKSRSKSSRPGERDTTSS